MPTSRSCIRQRRGQKINDDIANTLRVESFPMKELFSSLTATVFYRLVSLVLPGLTASSAWFVFFAQRPPLRELVHRNHTETAFVLMLIAIFVGTVIDDLGMRIESGWLDAVRERQTGGLHGEE